LTIHPWALVVRAVVDVVGFELHAATTAAKRDAPAVYPSFMKYLLNRVTARS
jgi:hypothetical protein